MSELQTGTGGYGFKLIFHRRSKDCLPGKAEGEKWYGYIPTCISKNWRRLLSIDEKKLKKNADFT